MVTYEYLGNLYLAEEKHNGLLVPALRVLKTYLLSSSGASIHDNEDVFFRTEDRLTIFDHEGEVIFDEVLVFDHKPPHEFKFSFHFVPKLPKSDLDFLFICLNSGNQAKLLRKM